MDNEDLKQFKQYYKNRLDLDSWKFELLNKTKLFNEEQTKKVIENEIYRISQMLDEGYPFVSYSYEDDEFLENDFFETEFFCNYHDSLNLFKKFLTEKNQQVDETHRTFYRAKMLEFLVSLRNNKTKEQNKVTVPTQPNTKQKPELNGKLIIFKNSETIEKIHCELKGYFPNKEAELLKVLQGEKLPEILLFPHNQNKFVEVFRRLKYNEFLLNTDTETKNWICSTFQFMKRGNSEPQPFNKNSVWDNLNKGKGEPTRKERICITDWLPYKSPLQLTREAENEKL